MATEGIELDKRPSTSKGFGEGSAECNAVVVGSYPPMLQKFGKWSMIGFTCTIMVTWEGVLFVIQYSLLNGGPLGSIAGYLFSWAGFGCIILCLAELNSMYPTSGGQYHWAFELAPQQHRRWICYVTGWQLFVGWQADLASAAYLGGNIIQGLAALTFPAYKVEPWQGTLIMIAVVSMALIFNTVFANKLHYVQLAILALHVLVLLPIVISMIVLGPHASNQEVWTVLSNGGGYGQMGTSVLVGAIGFVFAFMGADGATHMSEEVKGARTAVPNALVISVLVNGSMGFVMLLALLYCQGDITRNLETPTGLPFLEAFLQAFNIQWLALLFAGFLLVLLIFANVAVLTAVSRVTYAFARDNGLPFSKYFGRLYGQSRLPVNALLLSVAITALLGCVNIGSAVAFNAMISLVVASFFTTYAVPIGLLLWLKLSGKAPTPGPWFLGRTISILVNVLALSYLIVVFVFSFFPSTVPVTPKTMNWAAVLYGGTLAIGGLSYAIRGRKFIEPIPFYQVS